MTSKKVITEKTAWPVNPIDSYSAPVGEWGYLVFYSDSSWEFLVDERPTDAEILKRWGGYFKNYPSALVKE